MELDASTWCKITHQNIKYKTKKDDKKKQENNSYHIWSALLPGGPQFFGVTALG